MVTAIAYGPDGAELYQATRQFRKRAMHTIKVHNVRTREIDRDEFDLVYRFPPGSRIECEGVTEYWDGAVWSANPTDRPAPAITLVPMEGK